ncbi:transporter [Psychromonas sp. psych-6C06]|uniref:BON domain-containing protein n=1 Tax=Psychromonas sp. psych-6C06 TaxID=2058089 RepID=UPI000C34013D|nr:BON domain-containing protein [Psychromonas sp. psych-6C06]PKF63416.1 transporter [Psychromonas sp. psych-6C06]
MKQITTLFPFVLSLLLLQGCAGGLIAVAGTAVAVSSDERSLSTQIDDDNLSLAALDKINALDINYRTTRINLIANNAYLLIIGQVTSEEDKQKIENELINLKGVKEVYNQLRIKDKPIGLAQKSRDSWITTKAKSQLTAHEEINSFQIKVVTEDGELFLIGRVDNKTADAATQIARKISGVKQVNRVFQIIPNE